MKKPRTADEWRAYKKALREYRASRIVEIAGQDVNLDDEAPVIPFHSFGVSPPVPPSDIPTYTDESFGEWCEDEARNPSF